MKADYKHVYQFKITLKNIKPSVWRRIQVPGTYTFWDLHVAIQSAMGWLDYHLHEFDIRDPTTGRRVRIGLPDEEFGHDIIPNWERYIAGYFSEWNSTANYIYDFGDNWEHLIKLERITPLKKEVNYPICTGGARACPPEDCGGAWGYEELLHIIRDPEHEGHGEILEWIGGVFDPEHFDARNVRFRDPNERFREAFE